LERVDLAQAKELLSLPRTLGTDPADGEPIVANNGRYGPYVQKGKDYRTIGGEEQLLTITLEQALEIFAQPKQFRRGAANPASAGPLREFGNDPVSGKHVVAKDGRFGVYVTDGETNASLGKGDRLEAMPPERAYELLAVRREAIVEKGGPAARKSGGSRKSGGAAKKAPAKKAPAKKAAAKKSAPKKS
jgi:DNA topoisomerase-1